MFGSPEVLRNAYISQTTPKPTGGAVMKDTWNSVKKDLSNISTKGLRFTGEKAQDIGDGMAVAGYGLTLTGVGAEIGIPLAGAGNIISNVGTGMEIGADALEGKFKDVSKAMVKEVTIEIGQKYINKKINKIPGASELTKEILKQNTELKVKIGEKVFDLVQDQRSNMTQEHKPVIQTIEQQKH